MTMVYNMGVYGIVNGHRQMRSGVCSEIEKINIIVLYDG